MRYSRGMVKTVATVGFIAVVGVIGVVIGSQPTVIDGRGMAANLLPDLKKANEHVETVVCDRKIPIGVLGSTFRCTLTGDDKSTLEVRYTMDRDGSLAGEPIR